MLRRSCFSMVAYFFWGGSKTTNGVGNSEVQEVVTNLLTYPIRPYDIGGAKEPGDDVFAY